VNEREIIRLLWETGHFWSPLNPEGLSVSEDELDKLTLTDEVVKKAVASYQDFLAETLDGLAMREHGRVSIPDGEVGPATLALFSVPRCGCPDYQDPRKAEEAGGSGSWPQGCYDRPDIHEVHYTVDKRRMSRSESEWLIVRNMVLEAYAKVGVLLVEVELGSSSNIDTEWRVLRGSTIGLAEFNNGSCRDNVFCYVDPGFWPNNDDMADLWCHELGHNMNLPHTRGGIMNPTLIGGGRFNGWTERDPSTPRLRRFFGGEPIPRNLWWWDEKPEPPSPPGPPAPPPSGIWIDGSLSVKNKDGKSLGEFIVVPKPKV